MELKMDYNEALKQTADIASRWISEGRTYTNEDLWRELSGTDDKITPTFNELLKDARYLKLVELHTRKLAVKNVENISFIRGILSEIATLANTSMLEELVLNPQGIPFAQRRLLAKDLTKMIGADAVMPEQPSEEASGEQSTTAIAITEDEQLKALLDKYPEEMHESIIKRWKLERLRCISGQEHRLRSAL